MPPGNPRDLPHRSPRQNPPTDLVRCETSLRILARGRYKITKLRIREARPEEHEKRREGAAEERARGARREDLHATCELSSFQS